jgi:curved DNA-binding protein CbpA
MPRHPSFDARRLPPLIMFTLCSGSGTTVGLFYGVTSVGRAERRNMMESSEFVDYYEVLKISPNADSGAIERMFRYLAQRYHPDNRDTGDRLRFDVILEAHNTLRDPVTRARYDIQHKNHSDFRWRVAEEASDSKGIERDVDIQNKMLSVLYVKRRQNVSDPGIGYVELERLLDCPAEQMVFHVWYLKEKGWIGRTENGMLAITVEGVDRANSEHHRNTINKKLLSDQSHTGGLHDSPAPTFRAGSAYGG